MMEKTNDTKTSARHLVEEIQIFIQYSVQEEERESALVSLSSYSDNPIALEVLRDFYARLPEFREEAVTSISKILSRQRGYLLNVMTRNYEYLYFYDGDQAVYLGERKDGIGDSEILHFFGYASNEDFLKHKRTSAASMDIVLSEEDGNVFCPACSVPVGEIHQIGCPVEICPWCEGQLTYCNCRFDQLGVTDIVSEEELDQLEILLNEKGRIPFSRGQAPAYPAAGDD